MNLSNDKNYLLCGMTYLADIGPVWHKEKVFPRIPFVNYIWLTYVGRGSCSHALWATLQTEKYWGIYYEYDGYNCRTFRAGPLELRVDFHKIENKEPWKIGFGI